MICWKILIVGVVIIVNIAVMGALAWVIFRALGAFARRLRRLRRTAQETDAAAHSPHPERPCHLRARTRRKPRASSGSQTTRKPALTRKVAVDRRSRNDLVSGRSNRPGPALLGPVGWPYIGPARVCNDARRRIAPNSVPAGHPVFELVRIMHVDSYGSDDLNADTLPSRTLG